MQLPTEHGHESLLQSCESDPKGKCKRTREFHASNMLANNGARLFGLVRALLMGPLLAARYWLLTIAALVVAALFSGAAYAAVLDSREAEQMTLGTGAAISGSHVILNATGERVTWVDGG